MVATRVHYREALHAFDFIPASQHAAILNRTTSFDCSGDVQDAIDEAATIGGKVFLPSGKFVLGASLVPRRGVSIEGVFPSVTPTSAASWDLGWDVTGGTVITYPGGTVFAQDISGADGTAAAIDGIIIRNLGFDDVAQILATGATNKSGLSGSVLENLFASDVTGAAFTLINPMHVHMVNVKGARVFQLLKVVSDYDSNVVNHQPGNSYFADLYAYVSAAGQAEPTIHLQAIDRNARGTSLNYCAFDRVQINRMSSTTKSGCHIQLEGTDSGTTINAATMRNLDLEGYSQYKMKVEWSYHTILEFKGYASSNSDTDLYIRNSTHNIVTSADDNFKLNMDGSCNPLVFHGTLATHQNAGFFPIGTWQDKTKGGGLQLGVGISQTPWNFATPNTPVLPTTYFDMATGGGLRPARNAISSASLTMVASQMGYMEMTLAGAQTLTLPVPSTCPRQDLTVKKTGASGTVEIKTQGASQTIDGVDCSVTGNTYLDAQYKYLTLYSTGAAWLISGKG